MKNRGREREQVTKWYPFCFILFFFLTNNSRRNLSSSRAAGDVVFKCCWILDVPLLPPLMAKLFTDAATFAGFNAAPDVDIKFNGPRRSRRSSSSCLVSASTFATAKLSSFSFSLNNARIESRSLPAKEKTKKEKRMSKMKQEHIKNVWVEKQQIEFVGMNFKYQWNKNSNSNLFCVCKWLKLDFL